MDSVTDGWGLGMERGQRCMDLDSKCPELEHIHLPSSWTIPPPQGWAYEHQTHWNGVSIWLVPGAWMLLGERLHLEALVKTLLSLGE